MINLSKAPKPREEDVAELMANPIMAADDLCAGHGKDWENMVRTFLAFCPDWRGYHTEDISCTMRGIIMRSDEENQRLLDTRLAKAGRLSRGEPMGRG